MTKYICIVAPKGGVIGPAGDAISWAFDTYQEAFAFMERDISKHGGGECSYAFGTGYTDNGEIAYEIFDTLT